MLLYVNRNVIGNIIFDILYVDCDKRRESGIHWHFQLGIGPCQNEQRYHGNERGTKH